ncbi:MAG: YbjN domain-containing protein [Gemmatimonadetes bacterium]|nr:YbjN domain-containing protein [Gemmatimonadota bacterium]
MKQSRTQVRHDVRDDPGRMIQLAEEGGIETWLDTQTGMQSVGLPQRQRSLLDEATIEPEEEPKPAFEVDFDAILAEMSLLEAQKRSESLLDVVKRVMEQRGFSYETVEEHSMVTLFLKGEQATYRMLIVTLESAGMVSCMTKGMFFVPAEHRAAIAEAMTRANYSLPFGNFEMDWSDGEVRFRTGIDVEGGELVEQMVNNLIGPGVTNMDRYHGAFMKIVHAGATAESAIRDMEEV